MQPAVQKERPSAAWTSSGIRVSAPAAIVRHGCSCARLESFAVHMSVDCMGLGPYNVAKRTSFNTEAEVAPALLHAAKSKILCELRSVSVCKEDVLRLRVHPESLGFASVVCRLSSTSESPAQPRNPEKDDLGTDKHRTLWMISTIELRSISS